MSPKFILALTIMAMFALTIQGYPSKFIAKFASPCTGMPMQALGMHGAPITDTCVSDG